MKVGITTHYYNSSNYGGNLQAYALCKAIESMGFQAEQLCVPIKGEILGEKKRSPAASALHNLEISFKVLICNLFLKPHYFQVKRQEKLRKKAIWAFNQNAIPHSRKVFTRKNIGQALQEYQIFVCGSDLIWSPTNYNPFFLLDFVPKGTPKFSYAASMGAKHLSEEQQAFFYEHLANYISISVREEKSVELLNSFAPVPVELVDDPTFLLSIADWDQICSARIVPEPYVFCYFLGNSVQQRKLAENYAKRHEKKIANIPYLLGTYRQCDYQFGDCQLSAVSPADFLSLIRYADYVFTDSFHGCALSTIYEKQFCAFCRTTGAQGLSIRIEGLMERLDIASHYCNTEEKLTSAYIECLPIIDYSKVSNNLEISRAKSLAFLRSSLEKAKEVLNH